MSSFRHGKGIGVGFAESQNVPFRLTAFPTALGVRCLGNGCRCVRRRWRDRFAVLWRREIEKGIDHRGNTHDATTEHERGKIVTL